MTSIILMILWTLAASVLDNSFLLPGPFDVISSMFEHLQRDDFFYILISTSGRTLLGCLLSLLSGASMGVLCGHSSVLKKLFDPVHQMIKTIPNITYMLLILIWLGQEKSVTVIVFCILFPVFYGQFLKRTEQIECQLHDVLTIYPVTRKEKWIEIILPMLSSELLSAIKTGIGMGFKICVMAEILAQVRIGIGRQMNIGRLNLDLASVFGWTLWLILISMLLQKAVDLVHKITSRK